MQIQERGSYSVLTSLLQLTNSIVILFVVLSNLYFATKVTSYCNAMLKDISFIVGFVWFHFLEYPRTNSFNSKVSFGYLLKLSYYFKTDWKNFYAMFLIFAILSKFVNYNFWFLFCLHYPCIQICYSCSRFCILDMVITGY